MAFVFSGCIAQPLQDPFSQPSNLAGENGLCFPEKCITIERADDPAEQTRGLMYREGISENEGMLFLFQNEGRRFFWMKNVSFPIDIIWLSADKKVLGITNADPCTADPCPSYPSPEGVKYVLEVASGFSQKNNLTIGTEVVFSG